MRRVAVWALVLFIVVAIAPAKADTIAYNLVLTADRGVGTLNGTGSFSVTGPIGANQNFNETNGLLSLDFLIDGHHFALANKDVGSTPAVTFQNGNVFSILYPGTLLNGIFTISLRTSALQYDYFDQLHPATRTIGTITYSLAPVAVPGPIVGAGLPGLLAAAGGLVLLARRRRQRLA